MNLLQIQTCYFCAKNICDVEKKLRGIFAPDFQ